MFNEIPRHDRELWLRLRGPRALARRNPMFTQRYFVFAQQALSALPRL